MAEDMIAIITRYAPATLLKVEAETPDSPHGEMDVRPNPTPSARSARLNAAAATPPPTMLAQEIADVASEITPGAVRTVASTESS
jgi:hypothetical protein